MTVRAELIVAVVLTVMVMALGVYLGSTFFGERPASLPPRSATAPETVPVVDTDPPALRGSERSEDAEARLRALEREVNELRDRLSTVAAAVQPVLDLYERVKDEPTFPSPEEGEAVPVTSERESTGDDARKIARALGLDADRREAMATEFARVLTEIEALEKAHAEVHEDGAVTTIEIGKYAEEGDRVLGRWRDWIDRNLTPDEKEAYERDHDESRLLGTRSGVVARTIRIDETGGAVQVTESIATKDGPQVVLQGTAPAAARDLMLASYAHLLGDDGR